MIKNNRCDHIVCNCLYRRLKDPYKGGAGCLILTKNENKWVAVLGYEKYGTKNRNKLNLAAGGRNQDDNGCYIKCAIRELYEEFKIELSEDEFFKYFSDKKGNINYVVMGGVTPVFIGVLPKIDIDELNKKIKYDNNFSEDPSMKEMEFVDFVDIFTRKQINNRFLKSKISSFANTVINRLVSTYNLL
jgi:hypothetical protein